MVLSGQLACDNCGTTLKLRWVAVRETFRGHHVDPDCPLCGAGGSFQRWLAEPTDDGRARILVSVEPKER